MKFSNRDIERLNDNTLYNTVGISVEGVSHGEASVRLLPKEVFCWPFQGQPHGGILFTLMDTTMAWAVLSGVEEGYNCATINLDIQYTRRAVGRSFLCRARIVQKGNRIVYSRADISDEEKRLVAIGQGSFRIVKAPL
jgi:uncharacterized protein (TIGR00369 family)